MCFFYTAYRLWIPFLGILFLSSPCLLAHGDYRRILPIGTHLIYTLENGVQEKRTSIQYRSHTDDQGSFFIEEMGIENQAGVSIATSQLFFQAEKGFPFLSVEKNFKMEKEVRIQFSSQYINTSIREGGNTISHRVRNNPETVPYPFLIAYLRKNAFRLLQGEDLGFNLYLPFLLPQLKKMGFPPDFSIIAAKATRLGEDKMVLTNKSIEGVQIRVQPISPLLLQLLPKEKRELLFTLGKRKPHYILRARLGEGNISLTNLRQL